MTYKGEFVSVWDDDIEIVNECEVDLDSMTIVSMSEERRCEGYDIDTIDDEVEVLFEEYVYVPDLDKRFSACADYALEQWPEDFDDNYGNGIITYSEYVR